MSPSPMWSLHGTYDTYAYDYVGPIYVDLPSSLPFPASIETSDTELNALGATAIARCKPTSSGANLSVDLGELMMEGLPHIIGHSIWKTRAQDFRKLGDEYLNVEFGWLPLVHGIEQSMSAISNAEKRIKQYERDSGRLVRRRYEFPTIKETLPRELVRASTHPYIKMKNWPTTAMYNAWQEAPGSLVRPMYKETSKEIRRWFSGGFTYYVPQSYASRDKVGRAAYYAERVLGLELTPEVLWNLTPWSWAADWVGNIGDVLANVSDYSSNGLVLRYGYIMEHSIVKDTYTIPDVAFKGYGPRTLTQTHITEVKKRLPASPFGFGITYDSFSNKQKAILAALGISRSR